MAGHRGHFTYDDSVGGTRKRLNGRDGGAVKRTV
jgi:hypothetical protein